MTLVIVGHSFDSGHVTGLFAASDSYITSGGDVLVSGFKKVIEIPIRLKKLNIVDSEFIDYSDNNSVEYNSFIAFAGSTLVAQHIINSIRNHLTNIRPNPSGIGLSMLCQRGFLANSYIPPTVVSGLLLIIYLM